MRDDGDDDTDVDDVDAAGHDDGDVCDDDHASKATIINNDVDEDKGDDGDDGDDGDADDLDGDGRDDGDDCDDDHVSKETRREVRSPRHTACAPTRR